MWPKVGQQSRLYKLVQTDSNRIEYHLTIGAKIFHLFLCVLGVCFVIGVIGSYVVQQAFSFDAKLLLLIIGLILVAGCGRIYFSGSEPIVFDKHKGYFWKGKKGLNRTTYEDPMQLNVMMNQIHAIQLISKKVGGGVDSFYSYEVNLVLKEGKRLSVVDHPTSFLAKEDAQTLSTFLGVDIWANLDPEMVYQEV